MALLERAACNGIRRFLEDGQESVGASISIRHTAPTPVGKRAYAQAVVTAVAGRRITFTVSARDGVGPIGEGTRERVLIDREQFVWTLAERGAAGPAL